MGLVEDERLRQISSRWTSCGEREKRAAMNTYGHLAMEHWREWLPTRFSQLPDPEEFFTLLGEQVSDQIQSSWSDLQRANPPSETEKADYLANVGRLNSLRQMAEERVLAEMVFLEPEKTEQDSDLDEPAGHPLMDATGMPLDRGHPLWGLAEDDSVSVSEFVAAAKAWEKSLTDQD